MTLAIEDQIKETANILTETVEVRQDSMQRALNGKQSSHGFSDEWKSKRLGEVFQFLSTANNPRSDLSDYGEIGYIHYGDIHGSSSSFLDCSKKSMPYIHLQKVKNLPFLEEGDLVIADASEDYEGIGKSLEILNLNNKKIVAGLHTFLLRGNKNIVADGFKSYIQYIPSFRTDLVRLATGISVYGISKNNLRGVEVKLPPIHEQISIANTLSDIDSLITSLAQLITKKRNIKLAAMQQLLTGKQRLPGFSGKWEMKRFEDVIIHCSSGSTPSRSKPEFYQGNIRWITSGELNFNRINDTQEKITKEAVISANLKLIPPNTFLMAITGLEAEGTRGACGIVGRESTTNQSCMAIFPTQDLSIQFLFYYYVYRGKTLALQYCQGTKQQSYTAKIVKLLPIFLPPIEEQAAITSIFSDMDTELSALEQQLVKTRNLKQGMMQELLTGRIRLI